MLRRQQKLFWSVVLGTTLTCTVLVLAGGRTEKPKVHGSNEKASGQLTLVRGPMQNIRFTLYNAGIYPLQVHTKPGNVVIGIEARTGNTLGLVIQRQTDTLGVVVGQVSLGVNSLRGHAQFSLDAGRYVVFDASRPNNRAELLVEP